MRYILLVNLFSIETLNVLRDVSYVFIFCPFLIGAVRWKSLSKLQRYILFVVLTSLVNESITRYLLFKYFDSLWVYHIYVPVLFFFMIQTYRNTFIFKKSDKGLVFLIVGFTAFSIINTVFIESVGKINSNTISVASFVYVLLSIWSFYYLIRESEHGAGAFRPAFWFSIGNLLYYSGIFVLFIFVQRMIETDMEAITAAYVLNALFYIVLNLSYSLSLWVKPQA